MHSKEKQPSLLKLCSLKLPKEMLEKLDKIVEEKYANRSEAIRYGIRDGLKVINDSY